MNMKSNAKGWKLNMQKENLRQIFRKRNGTGFKISKNNFHTFNNKNVLKFQKCALEISIKLETNEGHSSIILIFEDIFVNKSEKLYF